MDPLSLASFGVSLFESIGATTAAREQGKIQSQYLQTASEQLGEAQQSLEQSLTGSLQSATLEGQRAFNIVGDRAQQELMQTRGQQEKIMGKSGFASMDLDKDSIKTIRKGYTTRLEDIDIGLTKNLASILSDFEKSKFQMQSQKQQIDMQKKLADQQSKTKYFGLFG